MQSRVQKLHQDWFALLDPQQQRRAEELGIQFDNVALLAHNPDLARKVGLTNSRVVVLQEGMNRLWIAIGKRSRDYRRTHPETGGQLSAARLAAVQKETARTFQWLVRKQLDLLTPEERSRWKQLAGPPFRFPDDIYWHVARVL
jgi:hypothetical protein